MQNLKHKASKLSDCNANKVMGNANFVIRITYYALLYSFIAFFVSAVQPALAASPPVRIKDIAHILEARENQLMGFGLVVGLSNSGDKTQTGFTQQAITNLLSRMGMVPQLVDFKSRNVAAVMVTATLPPFVKSGQKLDVTVSSLGDANSLRGGVLLQTPLRGADDQVYAVAQGSVLVGASQAATVPYIRSQQETVGIISNGAMVEQEVPVSMAAQGNLTIVIDNPDFTTANRMVQSIRTAGLTATAKDAGTISVPIGTGEVVAQVSLIENLRLVPDQIAKIVVNERTGTIVIGENVRLAPAAVSYAGIDVTIGDVNLYTSGFSGSNTQDQTQFSAQTRAKPQKDTGRLQTVTGGTTLSTLVRALNAVGATPKDLIAILQAMKKAGAIQAEFEVL